MPVGLPIPNRVGVAISEPVRVRQKGTAGELSRGVAIPHWCGFEGREGPEGGLAG